MQQREQSPLEFEQSFLLFDRAGRLLDWDLAALREAPSAQAQLVAGLSFRTVMEGAFGGDPEARTDFFARSQFDMTKPWTDADAIAAAEARAFEVRRGNGRILWVQERPTTSGGLYCSVHDVTAERRSSAAFAGADEQWRLDGDPAVEAFQSFSMKPDGSAIFHPPSDTTRQVFGLSKDFDLPTPPQCFRGLS